MEAITEQLIGRKITFGNKLCIGLLGLCSAAGSTVLLMLREALPGFTLLFALFTIALLGAVYSLLTLLWVEYEYRIAGDELTIDKITACKMRKTLGTIDLKGITKMGFYHKEDHEYKSYAKKIYACRQCKSKDTWYCTLKSGQGITLVLMTPNEHILEAMKRFMPKELAFEVFVKGRK